MIISFEKQNKHMHPFETICGYACVQELFMTSPQKKIRKTVVFLAWFPQNRQLSFTNFQHVFSYQFCFLVGGGVISLCDLEQSMDSLKLHLFQLTNVMQFTSQLFHCSVQLPQSSSPSLNRYEMLQMYICC